MKYDERACQFNMDTGCVELLFRDGRRISIDFVWSNRSRFYKSEAQVTQFIETVCFFIESGWQSYTVAEVQILPLEGNSLGMKQWAGQASYWSQMAIYMKQGYNLIMDFFGVDTEQAGTNNWFINSGNGLFDFFHYKGTIYSRESTIKKSYPLLPDC